MSGKENKKDRGIMEHIVPLMIAASLFLLARRLFDDMTPQEKIAILQGQLDDLVQQERYEEAAEVRDKINSYKDTIK